MRFHAHRIDNRVGANAAGHFHQRFANVGLMKIYCVSTQIVGKFQAAWIMIDGDNFFRAHEQSGLDGEEPDGPTSPYSHDIAILDIRIFCRHPARREDI